MRRDRTGDDSGYSLIELLIALVIVSTAVIGVLGLLGVLVISADRVKQQGDVEALAQSAAEAVKAQGYKSDASYDMPTHASNLDVSVAGYKGINLDGTDYGGLQGTEPLQKVQVRAESNNLDVAATTWVTKQRTPA